MTTKGKPFPFSALNSETAWSPTTQREQQGAQHTRDVKDLHVTSSWGQHRGPQGDNPNGKAALPPSPAKRHHNQ